MELAANYDLTKLACGEQPFLANGKIDAAIAYEDSKDPLDKKNYTYLFSGKSFIRYSGDEYKYMDSGYPKTIASGLRDEPISPTFPEESGNSDNAKEFYKIFDGIDAALKTKDGNVHLIKDRNLWVNNSKTKQDVVDTWLQTKNNFANMQPDTSIDAAIIDHEGGLVVFKGVTNMFVSSIIAMNVLRLWGLMSLRSDGETGLII